MVIHPRVTILELEVLMYLKSPRTALEIATVLELNNSKYAHTYISRMRGKGLITGSERIGVVVYTLTEYGTSILETIKREVS